jgi:2-methylcitrate dehydratase
MTIVKQLANYCTRACYDALSSETRAHIKIRILDSLGCAIGALSNDSPISAIRELEHEFGGTGLCTMIGDGRSAPDRAAFYNSALIRYLDFNDSYLAKNETCHPSDNLGAVLAACEYAGRRGTDLMASLALAYHIQCRLSDEAPVRARGFDHTTQGAYALAAGVSRGLGLSSEQTANALAICGTAYNALRVTRTGALSNWKGLAYPNTAFGAVHAAFLARQGITGPAEVFEGKKGFMESVSGPFEIDWSREGLDRVARTILKKYNAEIHSQSALEAALELRAAISPSDIMDVEVETFDVAYNIIGGGEEGDKTRVTTKEEADHSLQYMIAVALLDGALGLEQYRPARINSPDVQRLLRHVHVRPRDEYSRRFPEEMPARVSVTLRDGRQLTVEKTDYEGFHTRPIQWEKAVEKFNQLASTHASSSLRDRIIHAVSSLEDINVSDLTALLGAVSNKPA